MSITAESKIPAGRAGLPRDTAPDVLRGFALMGILIVNIPFMALNSASGASGEWVAGVTNGSAAFIMAAFFVGKFYLIFSFLFGYSSSYIIQEERSNIWRWLRRCIALIVLGALHFALLWHGDILLPYGVFGLLLIPFFFRTDRTLKVWSRVIFIVFSALLILVGTLTLVAEFLFPSVAGDFTFVTPLDEAMLDGSFVDAIAPRVDLWVVGIGSALVLQGGFAFAAFLLGLRLARQRFLAGVSDSRKTTRMVAVGFGAGIPIQAVLAGLLVLNEQSDSWSGGLFLLLSSMIFIAAPLLSMGYIGLILKLVASRPTWVAWMAPAGRMSLTVYIAESVLAAVVFAPWGFGLFQQVELWLVLIIGLIIWLSLVGFATLYLRIFQQGPLEWLVHAVTRRRRART